MDVSTITMPREQARSAFEQYRDAVKLRHTEEDEQIMRCYRELSLGHDLLDVRRAMTETGLDERGRPKLAMARASWSQAWFNRQWGGGGWFQRDPIVSYSHRRLYIPFPEDTWPRDSKRDYGAIRAIVPNLPPALRPRGRLDRYFILWEADWQEAPVDPILLRHVRGHLFAILAVWDLTEVERAVIGALRGN